MGRATSTDEPVVVLGLPAQSRDPQTISPWNPVGQFDDQWFVALDREPFFAPNPIYHGWFRP